MSSSAPTSARRRLSARTSSCWKSHMSIPAAQKIDDSRGTTSSATSSSAAIAAACTGPAPPATTTGKSRGSRPRAHGDVAHAGRHVHVDEVVDARRRLLDGDAQRVGDGRERRPCGLDVEPHPAGERVVRAEVAEHEVGVGDRRQGAAAAVRGRPGLGAGALRADVQQPALVHRRDRAAPGTDRVDVDHRQRERPLGDDAVGHHHRRPVAHHRDVEAGPAHVDGEAVADAGAATGARPRRSARRPGPRAARARRGATPRRASRPRRWTA